MATYSFIDTQASITGPGGSFSLGYGSGNAEEGIDVAMAGEKDVLTIGADGSPMHSLVADKSGKITVRLLKTSPQNAKLMAMYDAQSFTSSLWGQNVITVANSAAGDITTCRVCAFTKKPDLHYAKEGGLVEWEFNAGMIDSVLGVY
jgi:hypothetical protein